MNDPESLMCLLPLSGGEIWIEDVVAGTSVERDELGHNRQGTWHAYSRVFLFSATKRHIVRAAEGSCTVVLYLTRRTPSLRDAAELARLGFVLPLPAGSSEPGTEPSHQDAGAASGEAPLADSVEDEEAEVEVMVHRRAYQRVDERGEDAQHSAPPVGCRVNHSATIAEKDKLCEVVLAAAEAEISAHLEQARGKHLKGKDNPPQKDAARQKSVARFELDAIQSDVQLGVQIPEAWLDRIMTDPECSLEDMAAEVKSYLEANLVAAAEALLDIQDKESMDMCKKVKIKDVIIMTKRDGWVLGRLWMQGELRPMLVLSGVKLFLSPPPAMADGFEVDWAAGNTIDGAAELIEKHSASPQYAGLASAKGKLGVRRAVVAGAKIWKAELSGLALEVSEEDVVRMLEKMGVAHTRRFRGRWWQIEATSRIDPAKAEFQVGATTHVVEIKTRRDASTRHREKSQTDPATDAAPAVQKPRQRSRSASRKKRAKKSQPPAAPMFKSGQSGGEAGRQVEFAAVIAAMQAQMKDIADKLESSGRPQLAPAAPRD
eukprot:3270437-Amphidinium_carterae.2